jgi:aryl-alcohol dehydrogenase-like predicted oxidoreductase
MEYRTLGSTGTVVSTLCLGTMTFGAESDEKVAHEQLDRFVEQGGNFVDTADVYADGSRRRSSGVGSGPGQEHATGW